ncbi:MAG TPA: NADPH:quinone oxidoreductase family protein [Chloroflexia bacterium]|nr:NADPH:quinone oxidoreductase family protein [Chloroflexia bacterium]
MRAIQCKEFGPPESLVLEEVPALAPGAGQVVIRVHACGVNFPDTLIIQGKYQFRPPFPFAPGTEAAGVITAVGAGVTQVPVGARVIALVPWGSFAEEILAAAVHVFPLPPGLDFVTGASLPLTYGTAYHALVDRAQIQAGETLLVLGAAGGIGLATIQLGKVLGARVIAAASSAERLAVCRAQGADELIDYATEDLRERVKALTGGQGVDVVCDPVGGSYSEPAIRALAWGGRFLVIGFAAGDIPRIPLNLPLLKSSAILGVFYGEFIQREPQRSQQQMAQLLDWAQAGQLKPYISARYALDRAPAALRDLMNRAVTGKAVLVLSPARTSAC